MAVQQMVTNYEQAGNIYGVNGRVLDFRKKKKNKWKWGRC